MSKPIIDLSKYNTITNWAKVAQEVSGVILRCGYRGYTSGKITKDPKFEAFAKNCKAKGIPFAVYFMSQAITAAEGEEEAVFAVECANNTGATLPLVIIDSEDGDGTARVVRADGLSRRQRTDIAKAFCEKVAELGRKGGIYASEYWFKENLHIDEIMNYFIWCAKYGKNNGKQGSKPNTEKVDLWQFTSMGKVKGISGNVDMSVAYVDLGISNLQPARPVQEPSSKPTFEVGKNYKLQANMYVRNNPNGTKKAYTSLTTNAKQNGYADKKGFGILKKGTVVTCKGVTEKDGSIWIRIPSGYVCAVTAGGKIYVK